jgi:hypothetical protein
MPGAVKRRSGIRIDQSGAWALGGFASEKGRIPATLSANCGISAQMPING